MDFEHIVFTTVLPVIAKVMFVTYWGTISDYCINKGGNTLRRPLAKARVRLFIIRKEKYMINLNNVSKTFYQKGKEIQALKPTNLHVKAGEIFGIIGYSGAGKSTLLRCLNLLETPSEGEVIVDNQVVNKLNRKDLRSYRQKIGMIFQQFNLLSSKTVGENIAFNLKAGDVDPKDIPKRIDELLELVGLSDKKNVYPSQLSGGQKQRVGIAKALANNPKLLLCDEATSALDPVTTKQILSLLKEINRKLGITIILVTHEMEVIKQICDNVAVMENGEIIELNSV